MKSIKVTVKMHPVCAVDAGPGIVALGDTCAADDECADTNAACPAGSARVCECKATFTKIDTVCGKYILQSQMVLRAVYCELCAGVLTITTAAELTYLYSNTRTPVTRQISVLFPLFCVENWKAK